MTTTLSAELSRLLKSSLTSKQMETLATRHKVHLNTIRRIRDRETKRPNRTLLIDMIEMSIEIHQKQIEISGAALQLLEHELKKIKNKSHTRKTPK